MNILRVFLLFISFSSAFAAPAAPDPKTAIEPFIIRDAEAFEAALQVQFNIKTKDAKGWRAEGVKAKKSGDFRAATGYFAAAALLDKQSAETWLLLAQSYLSIESDKYDEKSDFTRNGGSAAYISFQRAKTSVEKAQALAALAQSLSAREMWRQSLRIYKLSLSFASIESVQAEYDDIYKEHGFRMLDYTSDNESASPRVCVQFSDPLAKNRIDGASFVTVNNEKAGAVRVSGNQLCVEDLAHGKRYDIHVKSGIVSVEGDTIQKPIDLTVYIRDRKPAVRFSNRNYVLPRTNQQGIPIVSVNTKLIQATVYRIGDRRLAAEVLDGDFQKPLEAFQLTQIANEKGEKLWSGQMPVQSKLNEEVVTAFPVGDLLPSLKPGLYVLAASAAEEKAGASDDENDDYRQVTSQWFVISDLGLSAFSGQDGIFATVRSLATAEPLANIELRLVARNNEILSTLKTDAQGIVRFDAGFSRGKGGLAPALLVARGPEADYGFLDLTKQAFDLSDRGVAGRQAPGPLDAFVFTERGVYRAGETVQITALLRDGAGNAVANAPLTLKIIRPDGVEDRRETLRDQGNGGRAMSLELPLTAMTGTWRVSAFADPKGDALYERTFLVEDYVPERLEMKLTATKPVLEPVAPAIVALQGRFLYGAPASNLGVEGEISVSAADALPGFEGYQIGQQDERFAVIRKDLEALPNTDNTGAATLSIPLPDLPQTSKALKAVATIRLREPSGRVLSDRINLQVNTGRSYIGVKPLFNGTVPDGEKAAFQIAGIGPDGKAASMQGVRWELQRVETHFQWYFRDGRWSYETINYETHVAGGTLDLAAAPSRIEAEVGPGQYRLDVVSAQATGPSTSLTFDAGWWMSENSDTPEILDLALDKEKYGAGDTLTLQILPRMAGKALVAIVSDKVLATQLIDVGDKGGTASFKVDPSWGPGAYASAILYRPMDSAAKRMPSRAVGMKWIPLDTSPRTLTVALETPSPVRPSGPVEVTATVKGLDAGEKATLVISGVDLGILNITRYKTPAPGAYFFGQRRLGVEIRDLYGKLIDGMQGVKGALRQGGDEGGLDLSGRPSMENPLAVYSGILEVGLDGKAHAKFDLPPFNGTMRLAAQVWSATKLGHGEQDVIVRDVVVSQATLPKFLMLDDTSQMHLSLENVEAPSGDYHLAVLTEGGLKIPRGGNQVVHLDRDMRTSITIPLQAAAVGEGQLSYVITGPGNVNIQRNYTLQIEPPAPGLRRRSIEMLAANGAPLRASAELIKGLLPSSAQIAVTASRTAAMDVPGLLLALDRYPFGCAEQTTSRALPLLYYNEVAARAKIGANKDAKEAVEKAIRRLYEMQSSSGAFGLWGPDYTDLWLTAYVADFLTRAREKGFAVRDVSYDTAIDRLRNSVNNARDFDSGGEELAYALYVLARSGRAVIGDLRYYADTKLGNFSSPLSRAQIGAALTMLGDRERGERAFASAIGALQEPIAQQVPLSRRRDYGTALRDSAAVLALMGETGAAQGSLSKVIGIVTGLRKQQRDTTTQENLWLLLAARTLDAQNKDLKLDVNGTQLAGAFQAVISGAEIAGGGDVHLVSAGGGAGERKEAALIPAAQFAKDGLQVKNEGAEAIPALVLVSGDGLTPEEEAENGFKIERKTYSPDGKEIPLDKVKQNDRVVVVLRATELEPQLGQIIVQDRLPAGFDIENPALLKGTDLKAFSWLPTANPPVFTSFRDDRFVAAFTLNDATRKTPAQLTMAYVMRAVTPGVYTHAGAQVEDMYRPDRFARTSGAKVEITAAQ